MAKRVWSGVFLSIIGLTQVSFAIEVPTPEEKAYFQKWTHEQDKKFPRQKNKITLPNGLEALIIQDPRAKKASVALDVTIGEAHDPEQFSGLAHFLEHMLFVSTDKYPELNSFDKFLADHNGSSNAYTATYHTNYHFDVSHTALEQALDRFGQFFISPKFDPSQLSKELEAVDAEYQKNIQQDAWGVQHFLNTLSNPAHPQHHDFQGNKETLKSVDQAAIKSFFEDHYSAHLMKLVIISPLGFDAIEGWVRQSFSAIRSKFTLQRLHPTVSYFPQQGLPRLITYKGQETRPRLELKFELPALDDFKYSSPHEFVSRLISTSRREMLRDSLIRKAWITDLSAHSDDLGRSILLDISFELTDLGRSHWQEIVSEFFQTIALIRKEGLPAYVYEETKLEGELHFLNSAPQADADRASSYASALQRWPSDEIEGIESLTVRYSPDTFHTVLDAIDPKRMQILMNDGELEGGVRDAFYDVRYRVNSLLSSDVDTWSGSQPHPSLVFPKPNPYRPLDFSLKGTPDPEPVLLQTEGTRLWVQTDHEFQIAKSEWIVSVISDRKYTKKEEALRILYLSLIHQSVASHLSEASAFDFYFSAAAVNEGISLNWGGFSDGFHRFISEVTQLLTLHETSSAEFLAAQEDLLSSINDELTQEPFELARSHTASLLSGTWALSDLRSEIESATLAEVIEFAKGFWSAPLFFHSVAFGNVTQTEASSYLNELRARLGNQTSLPQDKVLMVPYNGLNQHCLKHYEIQTEDRNHGVLYYLSFGRNNPIKNAQLEILDALLANEFFKDLRTEGKIGYVASLAHRTNPGQCGVRLLVQSSWPLDQIDQACLNWAFEIPKRLADVSEENFSRIKASLLEELQSPIHTFEEKYHQFSVGIFHHSENLNWRKTAIDTLQKVTLSDLRQLAERKLCPDRRRLLSVYALAAESSDGSDSDSSESSTTSSQSGKKRKREEILPPSVFNRGEQVTHDSFAASAKTYLVPRFR